MKALLSLVLSFSVCFVGLAQVPDCASMCCQESKMAVHTFGHSGAYRLVGINGNALPYTLVHEGPAPEVQSGAHTLHADGTFTASTSFRVPNGEIVTRHLKGTYIRHDSTIVMWWTGAGMNTAALSELGFTMNNEGILFDYERIPGPSKSGAHGYQIAEEHVVFVFDAADYRFVTNGRSGQWSPIEDLVINSASVAGDFNEWSSDSWRLTGTSQDRFEMSVPVSGFEGSRYWQYKFVVNDSLWVEPPSGATNSVPTDERNGSRNLVLLLP